MAIYERWQKSVVETALQNRRVVILAGARQVGKTTLAKKLLTTSTEYRTLDRQMFLEAARRDPEEFVKHSHETLIIDEIQRALELLVAIKSVVDENPRPGQYLLTGSADLQSLPGVNESLAGRMSKIRLWPLAQGELWGNSPSFLARAYHQSFRDLSLPSLDREALIKIALRGGYPEVIDASEKERVLWHRDYVDALLERDLKDIINLRRQEAMRDLLLVVAGWSSRYIDFSAIGSGLSIQRATLQNYLNALEALYLIGRIPPWGKTDYDRVGKQSKLMMADSGLMASLLRWRMDDLQFDTDKLGKLMETHVCNELQKQMDVARGDYALYHYRDREKREIDFIVEDEDRNLLGIEVKASTRVVNSDFKHLKWFQNQAKQKHKTFVGVVLYAGEHVVPIAPSLWAVPISALYI